MSNNNGKTRNPVKWIRDKAKSAYEKGTECYICGATEELELHHTSSLALLFANWAKENEYSITSDADILKYRDAFISEFHSEIYEQVYTLCAKHHSMLHKVYGSSPPLAYTSKQVQWIERQKVKKSSPSIVKQKTTFGGLY